MTVCVSLYDESGNMLRPWAEAGYECHCYDLENNDRSEGNLHFHRANLLEIAVQTIIVAMKPYFVFGFPPCTDVAVSGAAHFETKLRNNPFAMTEAADLPKLTWLWASRWFRFPEKAPVYCPPGYSPQHLKLGGTSAKTKQIRSETPRGFAKAVFMANRKD